MASSSDSVFSMIPSWTDEALQANAVLAYLEEGSYEKAHSILFSWRQRSPMSAWMDAASSVLALRQGQFDVARLRASKALESDCSCGIANLALAEIERDEGKVERALAHARRAVQAMPGNGRAASLCAGIQLIAGELTDAETTLRDALCWTPIGPGQELAKLGLAELLLRKGDKSCDEALGLAQSVCVTHPHLAAAWAVHGLAQARSALWEAAEVSMKRALLLEPGHPAVISHLIQVLLKGGLPQNLTESVEYANQLTMLTPNALEAWIIRARCLGRQGQFGRAFEVLLQAKKLHEKSSDLWVEIARFASWLGRFDESAIALEQARRLPGSSPEAINFVQVDLHFRQNRFGEGWRVWESIQLAARRTNIQSEEIRRIEKNLSEVALEEEVVAFYVEEFWQAMLFSRYLPLAIKRGFRVTLAVSDGVAPLFKKLSGIEAIASIRNARANWFEPIDRLPFLLDVTNEAIPVPFCAHVPATEISAFETRRSKFEGCIVLDLGPDPGGRLCELFASVLKGRNWLIVSSSAKPKYWEHILLNWMVIDSDAVSMAAAIKCADAVVCGDVSIAHLAGTLGVSASIFLSRDCNAIWGGDSSNTVWYPSLRLLRQEPGGDWMEAWKKFNEEHFFQKTSS